jgi:hypothetical protein
MFIVVSGAAHRMREVPAYLYEGQKVICHPVETRFNSMVIVDTGSDDDYRARYLRDRIASGMFGAVTFKTEDEAVSYIEGAKL